MSSIDERVHVFESMSQELSNAPETSLSQSAGRKPPQTITPLQPQQQPQPTAYQDPAIQEVVEAVPTTKTTTVIQGSDNRPPQLEDNYSPLAVTPLTISDSPYTNTTSGQEQPRKHQQGRKQSATNAIVSVQQAIRDVSDTELSHPRKRPKTLKPSIPGLVKDLTGPLGIERFKSHLIDYLRTPKDRLLPWISFTSLAHNESDSVEKILKCFELYEKLQNGTAFGKLLSLISRIEILDMIEGKTLEDPRQVWVPKKIPKDVCEQIISGLQPKCNDPCLNPGFWKYL